MDFAKKYYSPDHELVQNLESVLKAAHDTVLFESRSTAKQKIRRRNFVDFFTYIFFETDLIQIEDIL